MRDAIATISYPDIFGDLEKQVKAVKVLKKVFKLWHLKLEQVKGPPPVDTRRTSSQSRVPHIIALQLRLWVRLLRTRLLWSRLLQMIVSAMFMTLDSNIYIAHIRPNILLHFM